ncbi:MAG: 7-cyano-7-deazaguanine synthase QueC [Candidatus Omnitrophica bacterium]|nr:7-cyano-7-deazaguanine synthase QueC [Candidatus Omnitrophota bacterium]
MIKAKRHTTYLPAVRQGDIRHTKKAVILLSGGIDSATTLYIAKNKGFECFPLVFDYGQRHAKELRCAKAVAKKAGSEPIVMKISLPWMGSSLLDRTLKVPEKRQKGIPNTYVPGRNIVFMSFALSYAESIKADAIFIGAHSQDYSGYPDCRKEFFDAFNEMKNKGTKSGKNIKLYTPILHMNKTQIIKCGSKLNVPFAITWSCYQGKKKPCLKCDSCYYRMKGFESLGLKDPILC